MNKKHCREALDIYKKFVDRTDKVSHFLKVAEVSSDSFSDQRNINEKKIIRVTDYHVIGDR
jgi:hypothetical protein